MLDILLILCYNMGMNNFVKHNKIPIIVMAVLSVIFVISVIGALSASYKEAERKNCVANGKIYMDDSSTCREKTVYEKFDEECKNGIDIGSNHYSCKDIYNKGLVEAYVNNKTLIQHGNDIYEEGSILEVLAGKQVGDYCLSASDTWGYIGQTRCVVFTPTYFARSGRNFFIDEKQNYKDGFVVYMYGNYDWNWFYNTFRDKEILVCGQIVSYQGHPEIKTTPDQILISPKKTQHGSYTVYSYSCR